MGVYVDELSECINKRLPNQPLESFPFYFGSIKLDDLFLGHGRIIDYEVLELTLERFNLPYEEDSFAHLNFLEFPVNGLRDVYFLIPFVNRELDSAHRILDSYANRSLSDIDFKDGKRFKHVKVDCFLYTPWIVHLKANPCDFKLK